MGFFGSLIPGIVDSQGPTRNTDRYTAFGSGQMNTVGGYQRDDQKGYNANAFQYGGSPQGIQNYNGRLMLAQGGVDTRKTPYGNFYQSDWDRMQAGQARAGQNQAADLMMARAQGQTPSIAGMQAQQDMLMLQQGGQRQAQQAMAQQGAQAASARGAAGVAVAGQTAANNTANTNAAIGMGTAQAAQNISNQAQINAANERMQAEQGAFGAYSGLRGSDQSAEQLAAQRSMFNASQDLQSRQINDQRAMGYEGLQARANEAQLGAQMQQQGMMANSYNQAMAINAHAGQYNTEATNDLRSKAAGEYGSSMDSLVSTMGMASDERTKQPLSLNRGGKMYSPVEAKHPLTMDEMLDDRANQPSAYYRFGSPSDPVNLPSQESKYASPDDPYAQWERSFGSTQGAEAAARKHDNQAEASKIRAGFAAKGDGATASQPNKTPWWMALSGGGQGAQAGGFTSDERAKTPAERAAYARGAEAASDPFRPAPSTSAAVEAKQLEGKRSPKSFTRDTPAMQKKVSDDYYANLARQADEIQAGYKLSLARGGSIARDEGEIDEPQGAPPAWLSNYMQSQQPQQTAMISDERAKKAAFDAGMRVGVRSMMPSQTSDDHPGSVPFGPPRPPQNVAGREANDDHPYVPMQEAQPEPMAYPVAPEVRGQELPPPRPPPVENPPIDANAQPGEGDSGVYFRSGRARASSGSGRKRMPSDERTKSKAAPPPDDGAVAEANRAMYGQPYTYKEPFRPDHERPGQPHFGFMTQNLRKSPITSVAVEKDPETGMDHVDRDRMLQVIASGVSDLQRQQDETRLSLRKGGKRKEER